MSPFIHEDWLLQSKSAKTLYHDYAKDMPIYDFHSHLSPNEIAVNKKYRNMSEIWLGGDHYKWRALRWLGVEERLITGDAPDEDKFMVWARSVPDTVGNPLYHWTHLELSRYFGIDELLTGDNARDIWNRCNERLQDEDMRANGILKRFDVRVVCTTDDPIDELADHRQIRSDSAIETAVAPTFRPDRILNVGDSGFADYVNRLSGVTQLPITQYDQFLEAVASRVDYFHSHGCRMSDHGFEMLPFTLPDEREAAAIFQRALQGEAVSQEEVIQYQTYTLLQLGRLYNQHGWTMQLHIGAIRNNNARMFAQLGKDTGYDSILDFQLARSLNGFLGMLDSSGELPQTIVYTLYSAQYEAIASAIGNFQSPGVRGKVQLGSGWWYHDQKDGMLQQMKVLSNVGLISTFVGMLTDSRSFLSFTRHEYFRRVLCNLLGTWIEDGELPRDYAFIGKLVQDICFNNADRYIRIQ